MMQTTSKLSGQIAAEAGVSEDAAQAAAYIADLARAGKTLDEAAALLRRERADVRDIARDWGIQFADYVPGPPVALAWEKIDRGQWELKRDGKTLARVTTTVKDGIRSYCSQWLGGFMYAAGSSAEVAARRLSRQIERQSVGLFGVDDIQIDFPAPGGHLRLVPKTAGDSDRRRRALGMEAPHA